MAIRDPIGIQEDIVERLLLYFDTAFSMRAPGLNEERNDLLRSTGVMVQEPHIEMLLDYEKCDVRPGRGGNLAEKLVDDLGFSEDDADYCSQVLQSGLFAGWEPDWQLYSHQWEMTKSVMEGRPSVITSGTGSGKTEAFLLPILLSLLKESRGWGGAPGPNPPWGRLEIPGKFPGNSREMSRGGTQKGDQDPPGGGLQEGGQRKWLTRL